MASASSGKHFRQAGEAAPRAAVPQHTQAMPTSGESNPYAPNTGNAVGFVSTRPASKGADHAKAPRGDRKQPKRAKRVDQGGKPRRRGNVLSTVLIVIGVVLLLVAGGMWGYAQWQYHVQDVNNEKLAAYATVSDDAAGAPTIDWEGLKAVNADVCGWIDL